MPGNAGTYAAYLTEGYFSLVALDFADTTALDHQITRRPGCTDPLPHRRRSSLTTRRAPAGTDLTGTYVIWRYEAPQQ